MLKPSNTIFTIISSAVLLSLTGYLNGDREPHLMYVIIYLIIIIAIYSAIYIIKSFEKKIELKSSSLAFFGLLYSLVMSPFVSLLTLFIFLHLFFLTSMPKEEPDLDKSMGRFLLKNINPINKIGLLSFVLGAFFMLNRL
jgi:hypothetical protein